MEHDFFPDYRTKNTDVVNKRNDQLELLHLLARPASVSPAFLLDRLQSNTVEFGEKNNTMKPARITCIIGKFRGRNRKIASRSQTVQFLPDEESV